jgi:hypothetical protein
VELVFRGRYRRLSQSDQCMHLSVSADDENVLTQHYTWNSPISTRLAYAKVGAHVDRW